jgi:hypothetical protein
MHQSRDTAEKNVEVRKMDQIYSKAACVNVWLGDVTKALWWNPFAIFLRNRYLIKGFWKKPKVFLDVAKARMYRYPEAITIALDGTTPHWHERVWTLQEFLVARKVYLCCGGHRIYFRSDICWDQYGSLVNFGLASALWEAKEPNGRELERKIWSMGGAPTADRSAQDSRDYVFGILGLIDPDQARILQPDYASTTAEVFSKATAVSFIEGDSSLFKNLNALSYVSFHGQAMEDLPSWAINFHGKAFGLTSDWHSIPRLPRTQRTFSEMYDHPILKLRGFSFDTIAVCYPLTENFILLPEQDDLHADISHAALAARGNLQRPKESRVPPLATTVLQTLLNEVYRPTEDIYRWWLDPDADKESMGDDWWEEVYLIFEAFQRWTIQASVKEEYNGGEDVPVSGESNPLETHIDYTAWPPRNDDTKECFFFATEQGFVGVTTEVCEVGDQLVVPEHTYPFIVLRADGEGRWTFKGIPYVWALSKNEKFWEDWAPDESSREEFVLR